MLIIWVDVFYPKTDRFHFSTNAAHKYRTYKDFPLEIFLVVSNPEISQELIDSVLSASATIRNSKVRLLTRENFLKELLRFEPLPNPYRGV